MGASREVGNLGSAEARCYWPGYRWQCADERGSWTEGVAFNMRVDEGFEGILACFPVGKESGSGLAGRGRGKRRTDLGEYCL